MRITATTAFVLSLGLASGWHAAAAGVDYELWESVAKMNGKPVAGPEGKKRICQKPAGEYEMQDLGALPKHCVQLNVKRTGDVMTFDFKCDQAAAMREQMTAKMKDNPAALQAMTAQMPKSAMMTGNVVSRRFDVANLEQTITMKMPTAPAVTIVATGRRIGSCKELTYPPKPASVSSGKR